MVILSILKPLVPANKKDMDEGDKVCIGKCIWNIISWHWLPFLSILKVTDSWTRVDEKEIVAANILCKSGNHLLCIFNEYGVLFYLNFYSSVLLYCISNDAETENILLEKPCRYDLSSHKVTVRKTEHWLTNGQHTWKFWMFFFFINCILKHLCYFIHQGLESSLILLTFLLSVPWLISLNQYPDNEL